MKTLSPLGRAHRMFVAVTLALPVLLTACGGGTPTPAPPDLLARTQTSDATLAYFVTLPVGSVVAVSDMDLTLEVEQVKDSRCPAGTQCLTAGEVGVRLQVAATGAAPQRVDLVLPPSGAREPSASVLYRGHRLTVVEVIPYPGSVTRTPPNDLRVTLLLEKLRNAS